MSSYWFYGNNYMGIPNFKAGTAWDSDVVVIPNGHTGISRWGNTLYVFGNNGYFMWLDGDFTYTSKFKYSFDGQNIYNASVADYYSQYNSLIYENDVNLFFGTGETTLYVSDFYNKDIRLEDRGIGIKNILPLYEYGNNIFWGNNLDNTISDGAGNSNLWGSWEGNDTLTGGQGADTFLYNYNGGYDIITDANSNDTIWLFNVNPGEVSYYYDTWSNVMHLYTGSSDLQVNCATGDYWYPRTYPVYQFADGSRWSYEPSNGSWNYISWDTAQDTGAEIATNPLWGNANTFSGTDTADNFFLGKSDGNDLVFDATQDDTIHFCDAVLSDIIGTAVSDNAVAIAFNTGETAVVETNGNVSAKFRLASGESYAYNRETSSWQQA